MREAAQNHTLDFGVYGILHDYAIEHVKVCGRKYL